MSQLVACCDIAAQFIKVQRVSANHVISQHVTADRVTDQHLTTQHVTTRHVTSQHITSQHITYSTSHHVTLRHSTSRHSTAQHNTSCPNDSTWSLKFKSILRGALFQGGSFWPISRSLKSFNATLSVSLHHNGPEVPHPLWHRAGWGQWGLGRCLRSCMGASCTRWNGCPHTQRAA